MLDTFKLLAHSKVVNRFLATYIAISCILAILTIALVPKFAQAHISGKVVLFTMIAFGGFLLLGLASQLLTPIRVTLFNKLVEKEAKNLRQKANQN